MPTDDPPGPTPVTPTDAAAPDASASEAGPPDFDPFLRFRFLALPLFLVPAAVIGGLLGWKLAPADPDARRAILGQGALFGFYFGVLGWAVVESSLQRTGRSVRRLFTPAPRVSHAFEGAGMTAFHMVYELAMLASLACLVSLAAPGAVQRILDTFSRMSLRETHLTPAAKALSFVTVALLAPAMEELVFRGVLFHRLAARWGIRRGLVVSSLVFAILHAERAAGVFTFGLLMGLLYVRSGTLWLPTLCHVLNNGIAWIMGSLSPEGGERLLVSNLQSTAPRWILLVALTAPPVLLYFTRRWPARGTRLPWPAAGGAEASAAAN
jgi:membrane protease YdiL (CAAX protease family)